MAKLTYSMMISLDGYINDADGDFNWGQIDEEVHRHANAEARRDSIAIYGRRMYEMMVYWETADQRPEITPFEREFAEIWQGLDKIVVSKSLDKTTTARTRLVRDFSAADMERLKAESAKDISISGPTVAAPFVAQGLVDEIGIYYVPIVVGSGTPFLPGIKQPLKLERIEEHSFKNGVVFVRYRVRCAA